MNGNGNKTLNRKDAPNGWNQARALFWKDVRAELRTKVAVSAVGIFAFSALLLLGLATQNLKEVVTPNPLTGLPHPAWDATSKMGLLWVLLCFAAFTGLAHSFVQEEETGTVSALRLTMLPGAVYAGKLAFNLALTLAVAMLVTPFYLVLTAMPTGPIWLFLLVMFSGCLGLAGAATILAALAAKARSAGALFSALGLPFMVVFLILLLNAANALFTIDAPALRLVRDIGGLLSYGVLLITVSALVFGLIWEE